MSVKEIVQFVEAAIDGYENHLLHFASVPMPDKLRPLDHNRVLVQWVENAKKWNTAPAGRNINDYFFIALCYDLICSDKCPEGTINTKSDLNTLYNQVRQLGLQSTDQKSISKLFRACAIEVVWHLTHHTEAAVERMAMTFDFGQANEDDSESLVEGKEEKSEQDIKEAAQQQQEHRLMKQASSFIPMCTRIFFERWFESWILEQWEVKAEGPVKLTETHYEKYDQWIKSQIGSEPTELFWKRYKGWTYRQHCLIGTELYEQRLPHTTEQILNPRDLYMTDFSARESSVIEKELDVKLANAYSKNPLIQLAMYSSLFDCKFRLEDCIEEPQRLQAEADGCFITFFVVLRDQLRKRIPDLKTKSTFNVPRRPLIVQMGKDSWYIHDAKYWYPMKTLRDALLTWTRLIAQLYNGCLASNHSLKKMKWLSIFGF
jgi:hypothetical protein